MTATFREFSENGSYFVGRLENDVVVYDCMLCGIGRLKASQCASHEASFNHINNARAFELERAKEILAELVRHGTAGEYSTHERERSLKIVIDDAREFLRSI